MKENEVEKLEEKKNLEEKKIPEDKKQDENKFAFGGKIYIKEKKIGFGTYGTAYLIKPSKEDKETKSDFFLQFIKKTYEEKIKNFSKENSSFVMKENNIPNSKLEHIKKVLIDEGKKHINFHHPNIIRCYGYQNINDTKQIIIMDYAKDRKSVV